MNSTARIMAVKDITLEILGWSPEWAQHFAPWQAKGLVPGRVVVEDKHHFVVFTEAGVLRTQCSGKMLHQSKNPAALPKVGDWVAVAPLPKEEKGTVHHILPRLTQLSRKVVGRKSAEHILATNVHTAFVVQALDESFNPRLIERFLLMVREGGLQPVIVLNKVDLTDRVAEYQAEAEACAGGAPVITVSAHTGKNMKSLRQFIVPKQVVVFIGASGVGKSSLINKLYGDDVQATAEVRTSDSKGRHTTSWRELVVLPNGGLVIDTPGMREFHLWMAGIGMHETFPDIEQLSLSCKFTNCTHQPVKGCAVQEALKSGGLTQERYQSFLKLKHELDFLDKAAHLKRPHREKPQNHIALP
jgi:ribosome biogenesis GTPase